MVTLSAGFIGRLPDFISALLANPSQIYYFQNDGGKICLTRFKNRVATSSEAQGLTRSRFAEAVAAWQALTLEEKETYNQNQRAKERRLPGYQFFLSQFMKGKI